MTNLKPMEQAEYRAEMESLRLDAQALHDSDDERAANLAQRAFYLGRRKPRHARKVRED